MVLQLPTGAGGEGKRIKIWESEGNGCVFPPCSPQLFPRSSSPVLQGHSIFFISPSLPSVFLPFYITSHMTRIKTEIFL